MLSNTPADPTNVPPSPLTFETSSMPRLEAKLRRCFGPESSNTTTATRSWPIGWRPICRKALRSFVLHVLPGGRIRTNNGLENLNRQIRRRTRVVGIFPNTESALRLITAVVEEIHEDWLIGKQYLSLVDFKPQENPISDHSQSNYRKTVA